MTLRYLAVLSGLAGVVAALAATQPVRADETVDIGGSRAVLIKPAAPHGSVILMPGGDGAINASPGGEIGSLFGNQLVRTRANYAARGLAVLVVDANINLAAAVDYMAKIKRPVPATYRILRTGTLPGARKIKGRYAFSPAAFNAALAGVAA